MRTFVLLLVFVAVAFAIKTPLELLRTSRSEHRARSLGAVQSTSCPSITCLDAGGNCTVLPPYDNYPLCYDGTCTNGLCPTVPGAGQACTGECLSGYTCHPSSLICVLSSSINAPGGSCSSNVNCIFRNSSIDAYGDCQSGVCYGLSLGSSCTYTTQCSGRAFCDFSSLTCKSLIADGGSCSDSGAECTESDVCNSGTCVRFGSVGSGGSCSNDDACGDGYYCSASGTCSQPGTGGGSCSLSSDCGTGTTCGCAPGGTNLTCIPVSANAQGQTSIVTSLGDCVASSNCVDLECYQSKCTSQYCALRKYLVNRNYGSDCIALYLGESIAVNYPNVAGCSSSAVQVVVSASLVLVALFAVTF